jgi:site-specific DNA-methyltransferase (adenine-specific)
LVAGKLNKRKVIGMDISEDAVKLTNSRLDNPIKSESNLLKKGKDAYNNVDTLVENFCMIWNIFQFKEIVE